MPSLGSGAAVAVASTTLSPLLTSAAPPACLAIRPVSNLICLPPASSTVTSCFMGAPLLCSFCAFLSIWKLLCCVTPLRAHANMQPGEAGLRPPRAARKWLSSGLRALVRTRRDGLQPQSLAAVFDAALALH